MEENKRKVELSVIIPFVNEHPQIAFTVQSIFCELRDRVDFEIICIENWTEEVGKQEPQPGHPRVRDGGYQYMKSLEKLHPWLKVYHYDKKLSHWQAKNHGVQNSTGRILWFCDGHCIVSPDSLYRMLCYYRTYDEVLHGTLHLPLSYMLDAPGRELIYKLTGNFEHAEVHYSFTRYPQSANAPFQVPCMSTCGMMMSREIYDVLGGWPKELGIYGGGENFINFTLAVLGYTVNIFPANALWHYAAKRGYNWNYDDYLRNRMIATYVFGGHQFVEKFAEKAKGSPRAKRHILDSVLSTTGEHRNRIRERQVTTIEEWWERQHLPRDLELDK